MTLLQITVIVYFVLMVYISRREVLRNIAQRRGEVKELDRQCQLLLDRKSVVELEKVSLENKAQEIFTLYELTKDITKSLNEEEAFAIFRDKLGKHVKFDHCEIYSPNAEELKSLERSRQNVVFPLQWKEEIFGYLVVKKVLEDDKDLVKILSQQFALALRRVKLYQKIEHSAITDSLSQLYTHRYALERFEEELKRSELRKIKQSLLMIDVDFFKQINDTYGHRVGDQVLRSVAAIIKENIREIDIAGRYGGEEFMIVLPDTDRAGAKLAAERIRQAAENASIKAYDAQVRVTVSIGVATFPEDGDLASVLVDRADWSLYRAKKTGRNRVCIFGDYKK